MKFLRDVCYNSDDIELVIDNTTGEAFTTINGYARMSGIEKNTLSNRLSRGFKGVHKTDLKKAEVLTPGGLQGVHLIPADTAFLWLMNSRQNTPSSDSVRKNSPECAQDPVYEGKDWRIFSVNSRRIDILNKTLEGAHPKI